jgi:O-antigen/teichoic acid export membrane protein
MFEREKFQDLLAFGKWLFGSGILVFLITQGDDILVGKMLGVTALGFYQMAYLLSNLPATEITHVISQVTFPAYSKLQEDLPRLREAYLKVLQLTAFLSLPLAGIIFILAPEFINLFIGEKWIPMVSAMQALVLWGMIRSVGATTGPVFISTGNPEILTKLQFVVLTLLLIIIFPLTTKWGILGTSLAVVISALIPNLVAVYMVLKIVQCKGLYLFRAILPSIINTGIIVLILSVLKTYWITTFRVSEFILITILSIFIYLGLTYLYKRFFGYYEETFDFLQKRV